MPCCLINNPANTDVAIELLNEGKLNELLTLLRDAHQKEPLNYEYAHLEGLAYASVVFEPPETITEEEYRRIYQRVIIAMRDAIQIARTVGTDPSFINDIYIDIARVHVSAGNYDAAKQALAESLRMTRNNEPITYFLGWEGHIFMNS